MSIRRGQAVWSGLSLDARLKIGVIASVIVINVGGAALAFLLSILVVPLPVVYDSEQAIRNLELLVLLLPAICVYGLAVGLRLVHQTLDWLVEGRRPWPDEQRHVLNAPERVFVHHALFWAMATVVFGVYNAFYDAWLGLVLGGIVALSGLGVASVAYLTTERLARPLARQALRRGVPERVRVRSVAARTMFAWLLGTGAPLFGVVLVGVNTLANNVLVSVHQLAVTMLVLGLLTLAVGGATAYAAARASADPVRGLREAFAEVSRGNLSSQVQIYDGTELGHLQAGFNTMVAGLRERERLRDLFGRHVGPDVARSALEGTVQLGGESRRVAVLFVDIVGVSTFAREHSPGEVVRLLNRFLEVVVEVVHEHGGWINKFEDDGVLAVWGAPTAVPDMEAQALRAARVMADRLRREVTELDAGIGVSAGTAVAGNVGAAERYEYTVIGDPVNEAARLTDLAKERSKRVAVNAALLDAAGDEADHWHERKPVQLRGRGTTTRLATPLH
ncbi:adenylate/guanylate cyclase domain-containing protein [Nocardioides jiangxiensis]|uniref:Adenylate/guanylate cyclase domain-containing protein n=1 Tax=Nocardioides jiangxiensis TaxID=3064524 RepID=A0ABT9B2N7_9ACTN|nr:adenylate/guanylate cyclase domain-containing protein [Nocardioides sp. WY-20]MDO7869106.1 adenylate/guanylate cyclase domain-containing protein [Nocardioides sp. WY-20]